MNYRAPVRDLQFCCEELLGYPAHYAALGADIGTDEMRAIVEEIAKFAETVLAPLYGSGDSEGAKFRDGRVTSPAGFAEAYRRYVDAGWPRLGNPVEHGGHAAPYSLKLALSEFMQTANHAWCMYALINDGGIKTLLSAADQELIDTYVPKLISGEWLTTMCLTEPHCGSDLSQVRCRAEPDGRGGYSITGTKIFISSGEQDFTDNIVHLVLARLPDAPSGTRGISLFVVPKIQSNGEANAIRCLSIEHKMGLKGSATCVMAFEGAAGRLVGERNRGLNSMFVWINKSRLGSAQQGQAHAEGSYQASLSYVRERRAGRAPTGVLDPGQPADPLFAQPDIRRMLLTQRALAEGGRALVLYCAKWVDLADSGDANARAAAEQKLALLTPIAKGVVTEWGSEAADLGIQMLGGHGYMKEWPLEQRVRDVRITRIYEGTTGIQGMDLLGRKILGPQREVLRELAREIQRFCDDVGDDETLRPFCIKLHTAVKDWSDITDWIASKQPSDATLVGAVAVDYLMLSGYVTVGWLWAKSAAVAVRNLSIGATDAAFYRAKLETARFYFAKLLPRTSMHLAAISSGSDPVMGDAFSAD